MYKAFLSYAQLREYLSVLIENNLLEYLDGTQTYKTTEKGLKIVAMILEAANGGATKTKIMYKAFLSYAQLREYLSVLIENNLLEYLEGTQTYKTTEKGLNFLKMHNEIGELLQTPKF
jgi:predicted transcriptional regulator